MFSQLFFFILSDIKINKYVKSSRTTMDLLFKCVPRILHYLLSGRDFGEVDQWVRASGSSSELLSRLLGMCFSGGGETAAEESGDGFKTVHED
jgi:hypothetical protein